MKDYCVYTCITGDYDDVQEINNKDNRIDYLLFTNNKNIKSDTWDVIYLDIEDDQHKEVKILFHKYVGKYKASMWVDGQIHVKRSFHDLLSYVDLSDKCDMQVFYHTDRNKTVYQELRHISCLGLEDQDKNKESYKFLSSFLDIKKQRCFLGGILIRKNCYDVIEAMKAWMYYVKKFNRRDQLTLPLAIKEIKYQADNLGLIINKIAFRRHKENRFNDSNIYYFSPFSLTKNIRESYNKHCNKLDKDDWICITDYDTLFLSEYFHSCICGAIKRYPDTSVFGAYTNRLGLEYQLHEGKISDNDSVEYHQEISEKREIIFGSDCSTINKPIAGFFMLFKKSTFDKVGGFGSMKENGALFDYVFTKKALQYGPIRLIKGLYVFHRYRLGKNIRDISHLTN